MKDRKRKEGQKGGRRARPTEGKQNKQREESIYIQTKSIPNEVAVQLKYTNLGQMLKFVMFIYTI